MALFCSDKKHKESNGDRHWLSSFSFNSKSRASAVSGWRPRAVSGRSSAVRGVIHDVHLSSPTARHQSQHSSTAECRFRSAEQPTGSKPILGHVITKIFIFLLTTRPQPSLPFEIHQHFCLLLARCPSCNQQVMSVTEFENGTLTWLWVGGLALLGKRNDHPDNGHSAIHPGRNIFTASWCHF